MSSSQSTVDPLLPHPPLDRLSPLPLYAQIRQRLVAMILEWHDLDQRFYSDEQLCALFDVSRDTVRQAVAELVQAGLLTRGRGLGTFVRPQKLEERFNPGMDFLQQWPARGAQLQTTLLAFSRGSDDPATVSTLGFDAGTKLLLIKRVRAAAKVPVAIDYRYLRADLTADWTEESARGSPLHLLWQSVALDV